MSSQVLNTQRINKIDQFVGRLLDAYKSGNIDKSSAVRDLGHIFSAIDKRNETELDNFPENWKS